MNILIPFLTIRLATGRCDQPAITPVLRRAVWSLAVMAVGGVMALGVVDSCAADDWPQWMGPQRDGVYRETGVVEQIPEEGLPVLWRQPVSHGYSGPAVAAGKVLVTDYVVEHGEIRNDPSNRHRVHGKERVLCLEAASGEVLWTVEYERPYQISYPNGPRATPTVDGKNVYVLGAEGDLLCLHLDDGHLIWKTSLPQQFGTQAPLWGYAAHPLVAGELVYCMAGGQGSAVVALDKRSGAVVWQNLDVDDIGYCPPMIHTLGGKPLLIVWHSQELCALDPLTGEVSWHYPLAPRYGMAIAAPQLRGNLLFASGIGQTAAMLPIGPDGKPGEPLWTGRPKMGLYAGNATPLFTAEAIFGSDCETGQYMAIDPHDGTRLWSTFELTTGGSRRASHGTAFTVRHGEHYFIFAETGDLLLADLSRDGFRIRGRMHVVDPTSECFGRSVVWSHPAFAQRCVFVRNDREIVCVSLAVR
ncbi:MAG: hypothetical protein KatS3mg111_2347 [Pirellulaceae bacterium]|nr:MAG: hypothetical protein KatS3mg111_2347 [Pirellulaceae bacterium]